VIDFVNLQRADFFGIKGALADRGAEGMTPGVIKIPNDVEGVRMKSFLTRLWQEEEGQDLTEYGLLLVLVALAAITSMSTLANAIKTVFSTAAANLSSS
jgi:pilus assembly protein Flp/PilA